MTITKNIRAMLHGIVIAGFAVATSAVAADAKCLSNKQARNAVQAGKAVQLSAVRGQVKGEIVKARLCRKGANYFYRITVLSKKGDVKKIRINANQ